MRTTYVYMHLSNIYIYIYIYMNISTACMAHEQLTAVAKASDTQAVGHGFEPRPDHN